MIFFLKKKRVPALPTRVSSKLPTNRGEGKLCGFLLRLVSRSKGISWMVLVVVVFLLLLLKGRWYKQSLGKQLKLERLNRSIMLFSRRMWWRKISFQRRPRPRGFGSLVHSSSLWRKEHKRLCHCVWVWWFFFCLQRASYPQIGMDGNESAMKLEGEKNNGYCWV